MAAAIGRYVEVAVLLPSIPSTVGKKQTKKRQINVQEIEVTLEQLLPFDFFVVGNVDLAEGLKLKLVRLN